MIKSSIILAAGLGKRTRGYASNIPKPLIEVNGQPLIKYSINFLEELGFNKIIINVHYKSKQLISYLNKLGNPKIHISDETNQLLDTGGGIRKIIDDNNIDQAFVINCDNLWNKEDKNNFGKMINNCPNEALVYLGLTPIDLISGYYGNGDFSFINDKYIRRYSNQIKKNYVYNGAQIIKRKAFEDFKNNVFSINDVWDKLISKNLIQGYKLNTNIIHLGTTEALKDYFNKL